MATLDSDVINILAKGKELFFQSNFFLSSEISRYRTDSNFGTLEGEDVKRRCINVVFF